MYRDAIILPSWLADPSYCRDRLSVGQAVFLFAEGNEQYGGKDNELTGDKSG